VSVVVGEFEVVPEQERGTAAPQQTPSAPPQTDAQRRHELEDTLRLIESRNDRLRAD
jgi:hypothetical protein